MSTDESNKIQELIERGFKGIQIRLDAFEEVHTLIQKQQENEMKKESKLREELESRVDILEQSVSVWIFFQKHPIIPIVLGSLFILLFIWLDLPHWDKDKIIQLFFKNL